ncbi:MAG: GIY-YIG nuclease family protein [Oligoflexia bacterium]|nr:GIY-YIG nuclease family protein [Oligoflexia bacterium]
MSDHQKYPPIAGIYKFYCNVNGKIYIGKSINLKQRIEGHKRTSKQLNGNYYFENALIKHGWDNFTIEILETFNGFDKTNKDHKNMILDRESFFMKKFDSSNLSIGYNICKFSTDRTGVPQSELTKKKIGNANRGRFVSDETKEKLRLSHLGNSSKKGSKLSEESITKLRIAGIGRKHSEETKQKMSEARLGKTHSEESKEKMRKPKVNKENLGKSFLGRKHSDESKEKMRQAKLNKNENIKI